MTEIKHFVGNETLVVVKCWCGITFAIPESLYKVAQGSNHQGFHCPSGHPCSYRENDATRLEKQLQQERAAHDQTRAAQRESALRAEILEKQQRRLKKRIANGICPCCHRTVRQLQQHMKSKHPDYSTQPRLEKP